MQPNPLLKKLGYANDDRVVIVHVDDIGMCQACVNAYDDLLDFGLITSAALMTPCPWYRQAISVLNRHPSADIGVHLTLTSEWDTYRWGPISTRDPQSGMIDAEGYFYRDVASVQANADPVAVQAELTSQVERVLSSGIHPTHADTHMGAVASIKFLPAYLQVATAYGLPPMLFRLDEAGWMANGLDPETVQMAARLVEQLEGDGLPLLDYLHMMPLDQPRDRIDQVKRAMQALPAGITHFIIHAAKDTPELRAIAPDWPSRVADYQTFMSEEMRAYCRDNGIQLMGYRPIREQMVAAKTSAN
jgi:predicted glycoside hydrolase/deacetylase ChbG (UPF0249 family)